MRSFIQRAELARDIYRTALEETESFEHGRLGLTLAYLMGAILEDSVIEIFLETEAPTPARRMWIPGFAQFVDIPAGEGASYYADALAELRRMFPADHAVWSFIKVCNDQH